MKLYATSPSFGADAALFLDDAAFAIFFEGAAFAGAAYAGFFVAFGSGLGFSAFAFDFDEFSFCNALEVTTIGTNLYFDVAIGN